MTNDDINIYESIGDDGSKCLTLDFGGLKINLKSDKK
jgi:hypothetical protein